MKRIQLLAMAVTVIAFLFEKIFLAVLLKKKLGIGAREYVPVRVLVLYSVFVAAVFIFAEII